MLIHKHISPLPEPLQNDFPNGACVVYDDGTLQAAIPASWEETMRLIETTSDFLRYGKVFMKMAAPKGYRVYTEMFKEAVGK